MDEELLLARIIAGIEAGGDDESYYHELVTDLKSLLDTDDDEILNRFYGSLSSVASSFLRCVSAAMDSPVESGRLAILASDAYLCLLLSANCPVFTFFSPVVFLSLLGSVRRYLKRRHREDSGTTAAQGSNVKREKGIKKKRGRDSRNKARNSGHEDGDETEEGEFDAKLLFRVLERLGSVLSFVHLDRFPDSLKSLVQTVSEIPLLALEYSGFSNFDRLIEMCGRILGGVLNSDHGDMALTAAEISKSLTPMLLMGKHQARSFALGFVSRKMMALAKDNSELKKALSNLPKFLVHKAPEKAEPRGFVVEAILEIVKAMEVEDQSDFVDFVMRLGQGKSNLRILAVDLIPLLISSLGNPLGIISSENGGKDSWGLGCLNALLQRCSDSSSLIRARALSNLAQVVGFLSVNERSRSILKEALGFNGEVSEGNGVLTDLLKKRCVDEKAAARRAALLLVTKLTSLLGGCFDVSILKTMGTSCSDPLISIRKAAISALSEAFRICTNDIVTMEWLHSVPRMIMDNETSIQEECESVFHELVLERISRAGIVLSPDGAPLPNSSNSSSKDLDRDIEALFPEGVLALLKELCNSEVSPWVKKICGSLGKKKQLKPRVAFALQNIIKKSESLWLSRSLPINKWTAPAGAWFLLSEVSVYLPKSVEWEFLHHHWQLLDKNDMQDEQGDEQGVECNSSTWAGDRVCLLQTISNVSLQLPAEPAADLADNLLKKIEKFDLHSAEVDAHVKALKTLCKKKACTSEESDMLVKKWVEQVLSKASKVFEKYIEGISNNNHSFATPATLGSRRSKRLDSVSKKLSKALTAVYTIGSCLIIYPSADTTKIVPLLHTVITSGDSDSKLKNKLSQANVCLKQKAPSLYNQSWLTMAKICLADGKLAKRYIPLFAQELEKSDCAALRNNLVVAMTDFCVHYTAMIECYIPKITKRLRDPCEVGRRQTFILLSRLLQRDYVKWRGVLFLRFLLSLVDESEKIRQLADFLFGIILKVKAPLLAYNSFVEAIYVLNDCQAHNGHNNPDSKQSRTKDQSFSIRGNDERARSKRMHIYITLLKQMAPEHLLATFAKLCAEVLAAASDGMLNIEDVTGQSVLQDAFQILMCKEIRLSVSRGASSETVEMEDEGGDSNAAAKGRAITQAVRKGLIQNTIPIFIELKRLLESKNSPLTGSLMDCLRVLLKDYKNEIEEMLVADRQLQKELVYDMQKHEAAKARTMANQGVGTSLRSGEPEPEPAAATTTSEENVRDSGLASRVVSAAADAVAAKAARSVLREMKKGGAATPPLSAMSVPKLRSRCGGSQSGRPSADVLESLRRRPTFMSDDES